MVVSGGGLIQLALASIKRVNVESLCVHIMNGNYDKIRVCCWHRSFAQDYERCHDPVERDGKERMRHVQQVVIQASAKKRQSDPVFVCPRGFLVGSILQ